MPYRTIDDLPPAVKDHLPRHAQEIFLEAYNSAWEQYSNPAKRRAETSLEETANRVAWAAVGHRYEKNEETGQWQEKERSD
jgi:cation transport regulator